MNNDHDFQIQDLQSFFPEFKRRTDANGLPPQVNFPDISETKIFFQQFQEMHDSFIKSGGAINVWEVAGIGEDELRNCAVLGWLLDCRGSHGQKESFLQCFLKCLKTFPRQNKRAKKLLKPDQVCTPYRTTTEKHEVRLDDQTHSSRPDIVIEHRSFLLFIEAKIGSEDDKDQLAKYGRILRFRARNRPHALVFLTKTGDPPLYAKSVANLDCLAYLSWRHLANELEALVNTQNHSGGKIAEPQPIWAWIVEHFCRHISQL